MIQGELKVSMVQCQDLRPDPKNPRKPISGRARAALKRSLEKFGMVQPILHSGGLIFAGHQRLEVWWRDLGHSEIAAIDVGPLKTAERQALNIALNKISGEWDNDKLSEVMREIRSTDEALAAVSGFADRELASLLGTADVGKKTLVDFSVEPDPGKAWLVVQGTPANVEAARKAIEKEKIKVRVEAYTEAKS